MAPAARCEATTVMLAPAEATKPANPMNEHYPRQVHPIVRGCDVAVLEYLSDVKKVRSLRHDSPNAHRSPGWRHEDMLINFRQHGWEVFEYDLNAWCLGSAGARAKFRWNSVFFFLEIRDVNFRPLVEGLEALESPIVIPHPALRAECLAWLWRQPRPLDEAQSRAELPPPLPSLISSLSLA